MDEIDGRSKQLQKIKWYRAHVDPQVLVRLNRRSNWAAWKHSGGFLVLIAGTGTLCILTWQREYWWLPAGALFLHGTICAFCINAMHELVHGTVFKNQGLNQFFAHLFGFLRWQNNRLFWLSHKRHHASTLHPPEDLEVQVPQCYTLKSYLKKAFINIPGMWWDIKIQVARSFGIFRPGWELRICPPGPKRDEVINWSRGIVLGHIMITGVSLWQGYWIIPIIVSLTPLYGTWLFILCNEAQHMGLSENIPDFRLNSRTILLKTVLEFLYWRMNYHIEHHTYAAVPCYNLPKLHQVIRHELPRTSVGLIQTWIQIAWVMYQQDKDKAFRFIPELPNENGEYPTQRSRLTEDGKLASAANSAALI